MQKLTHVQLNRSYKIKYLQVILRQQTQLESTFTETIQQGSLDLQAMQTDHMQNLGDH